MAKSDDDRDPFGRPIDSGGTATLVPPDQIEASLRLAREDDAVTADEYMAQINERRDAGIAELERIAAGDLDEDDEDIDESEVAEYTARLDEPPESE